VDVSGKNMAIVVQAEIIFHQGPTEVGMLCFSGVPIRKIRIIIIMGVEEYPFAKGGRTLGIFWSIWENARGERLLIEKTIMGITNQEIVGGRHQKNKPKTKGKCYAKKILLSYRYAHFLAVNLVCRNQTDAAPSV
jgi:hypothetical protein